MLSDEVRQYLGKVCSTLNKHDVDYIVVGGAAVSHHGYHRPSGIGEYRREFKTDLDFWYKPSVENYHKILSALRDLEVDTVELEHEVFDPKRTFLKIPHKDFHTDFLPIMEGLGTYRESKPKVERETIDGVEIPFLSYEDIIANKRAINRKIDQSDIEALSKIKKGKKRGRGL